MPKFKVKFRIEKLELEIEGEKESIPEISSGIREQFGNLLGAPEAIVDAERTAPNEINVTPTEPVVRARTRRRSARTVARSSSDSGAGAIDFQHDPSKWGNPQQSWSTVKKAMWLLYVCQNEASINDMSGSSITETFNKHFRQSGQIKIFNVNRDLGKAKGRVPAQAGEDTTKNPSVWFLTDEGKNLAHQLVLETTGSAA